MRHVQLLHKPLGGISNERLLGVRESPRHLVHRSADDKWR